MRTKFFLLFLVIWIHSENYGQQLRFRAVFGGEIVRWNKSEFTTAHQEKIRFSDLSFYLSGFSWYQGEDRAVHEHQRVELLGAGEEEDSMVIAAPFIPSRICFRFGLDSATQVSGRTDGALDPALGMYWAWNTGYIQCRLEGTSPDSKAKKGKFEFHLGGYQKPFSTDFKVCLDLPAGNKKPEILLDLKPMMDAISLKKTSSVLSPGEQAWELSRLIGLSFQSAGRK